MSKRKLTPFRRKYLRFRLSEARRNLKLKAIEYKGGKCVRCEYNKCPTALVFHHLDPSKKDFQISNSTSQSFDKCKNELDKCILLCHNCHSELHYEEWQKERQIKLDEINNEKRILGQNVSVTCDTCHQSIIKFSSRLNKLNFCDVNCKKKYSICSDEQLKILLKTKTIKEISFEVNLSVSTIYRRIRKF